MAGDIEITAIIDGGSGEDKLKGGGGNDILLGGRDDDDIDGGGGANILLGGLGRDRLVGGKGDDILVADRTAYDSDETEDRLADTEALLAILAEWSLDKSVEERRGNISGKALQDDRLNNGHFLILGETILDDEEQDKLTGSSGEDWFILSSEDRAADLGRGDYANDD